MGEGRLPKSATTTNVVQIIRHLAIENDIDPDRLLNLAWCESRYDPTVRGVVDNRDRGIFQINSFYHPTVSDECAFDVYCATEWTIKKIKAGGAGIWVCKY